MKKYNLYLENPLKMTDYELVKYFSFPQNKKHYEESLKKTSISLAKTLNFMKENYLSNSEEKDLKIKNFNSQICSTLNNLKSQIIQSYESASFKMRESIENINLELFNDIEKIMKSSDKENEERKNVLMGVLEPLEKDFHIKEVISETKEELIKEHNSDEDIKSLYINNVGFLNFISELSIEIFNGNFWFVSGVLIGLIITLELILKKDK